jgi:hypothetical protein
LFVGEQDGMFVSKALILIILADVRQGGISSVWRCMLMILRVPSTVCQVALTSISRGEAMSTLINRSPDSQAARKAV